jgi:hypothetical protein
MKYLRRITSTTCNTSKEKALSKICAIQTTPTMRTSKIAPNTEKRQASRILAMSMGNHKKHLFMLSLIQPPTTAQMHLSIFQMGDGSALNVKTTTSTVESSATGAKR